MAVPKHLDRLQNGANAVLLKQRFPYLLRKPLVKPEDASGAIWNLPNPKKMKKNPFQ